MWTVYLLYSYIIITYHKEGFSPKNKTPVICIYCLYLFILFCHNVVNLLSTYEPLVYFASTFLKYCIYKFFLFRNMFIDWNSLLFIIRIWFAYYTFITIVMNIIIQWSTLSTDDFCLPLTVMYSSLYMLSNWLNFSHSTETVTVRL